MYRKYINWLSHVQVRHRLVITCTGKDWDEDWSTPAQVTHRKKTERECGLRGQGRSRWRERQSGDVAGEGSVGVSHLEDGEREALPEQEARDQLHQVREHAAAEAGQLLELVPQTELEGHLQGVK